MVVQRAKYLLLHATLKPCTLQAFETQEEMKIFHLALTLTFCYIKSSKHYIYVFHITHENVVIVFVDPALRLPEVLRILYWNLGCFALWPVQSRHYLSSS